jgi:isoamylase
MWWGTYDFDSPAFDWGPDYTRPDYSLSELVIYEMSVRCFTASETSGVPEERRGTYMGVAEKVRRCLVL